MHHPPATAGALPENPAGFSRCAVRSGDATVLARCGQGFHRGGGSGPKRLKPQRTVQRFAPSGSPRLMMPRMTRGAPFAAAEVRLLLAAPAAPENKKSAFL